MTADGLLRWMAGHRATDPSCSRCGRVQVAYFRDHLERPVGPCCLLAARTAAEMRRDDDGVDRAVIARRRHDLFHDCPAEGCMTCIEAGR